MVSKGAMIGLVGLLVIALVGGSAYILLRPDDASGALSGAGYNEGNRGNREQGTDFRGRGQNQSPLAAEQGGQGNGFQGGGQNQGGAATEEGGESFRGGGSGQDCGGADELYGEGLADHPSEEWTTLRGSVAKLDTDILTLQTSEGSVAVHLGPGWYWETEGIDIAAGHQVVVTGFYEGDTFEVARVENLVTGATVALRDETGRPMWSGRGRQGQVGSLHS